MKSKSKSQKPTSRSKKVQSMPGAAVYAQKFTAHFSDCDPERILFFATYFKWAHDAIEGLTHSKGLWADWFENADCGAPLRHVEADYFAPLQFGESADALVHVASIGETSITFETHFLNSGKVTAVVRTVHVFVDRKKFKATKVPDKIIRGLTL